MKRKVMILMLVFTLLLVLTGCWSRRELNELGIVVAIGFDKTDDGQIETSVQLVNPGEIAKDGGAVPYTPVTVYSATAPTVFEGIRKLAKEAPRLLYFPHTRIITIGEELAREGIKSVLDLISRDHEFRTDFYIIVAKDSTARSVLNVLTQMEKIPSSKMFTSLKMSQYMQGSVRNIKLDRLIMDIVSDGKEPVLTGIEVVGNTSRGETELNIRTVDPFARLVYQTIAVFRKDKLVGWLGEEASIGYNFITNHIDQTVSHVACPNGGKVVYELLRSQTNVEPQYKAEKPQINLTVEAEANIGEVVCGIDLTQEENFKRLEKRIETKIEAQMNQAIETAQADFQADIFGFGQMIHKTYPKKWRGLKEEWNETFAEIPVTVEVKMHLRRTGSLGNSFIDKLEE